MQDRRAVARAIRGVYRPIDDRPIWEWAADNVTLPASIVKSGKFDIGTSKYFQDPLRDLQDNRVRRVNVRWPVRHGKTLLCDLWIPWTLVNDPGPFLSCWQTDSMAKSHAESRLIPTLNGCPAVAGVFSTDRHKTKTQTVVLDSGVAVWVRSGGSLGELQSRSVRYLAIDEGWTWEKQSNILEAEGRIGDWEEAGLSKVLYMSQGSVLDDLVDIDFKAGSQSEWHFPCEHCGELVPARLWGDRPDGTKWGLTWDKKLDAHGQIMIGETLRTIRFECPHCRGASLESSGIRTRWLLTGQYIDMNPTAPSTRRSYTLSAIMGRSWELLVEEWIKANAKAEVGIIEPLVAFVQKRIAQPWDPHFLGNSLKIQTADYDITEKWADETVRFLTVDVQDRGLLFYVVRAWSRDGRSRRLDFGSVVDWPAVAAKADEWGIGKGRVAADRGWNGVEVGRECASRGWLALDGDMHTEFYHEVKKGAQTTRILRSYAKPRLHDAYLGTAKQGKGGACVLVVFSDDRFSDQLHSLMKDPRGVWQCPADTDPEREKTYKRHMAAMKKVRQEVKTKLNPDDKNAKAIKKQKWTWVSLHKENHLFDCEKMQVVMATLAGIVDDPTTAPVPD